MTAISAPRLRPPLQVILAWHPDALPERSRDIALRIYTSLSRDESNPHYRGAGIPVYFCSDPEADLHLGAAEDAVVVPLVTDEMIADGDWNATGFLERVAQAVRDSEGRHRLLPVAISSSATKVTLAGHPQSIRVEARGVDEQVAEIEERLYEFLCRLVLSKLKRKGPRATTPDGQPVPVKLFLSHAKRGRGIEIVQAIRDELNDTSLKAFYDASDIVGGSDWERALRDNAGNDAMIAVLTDPYSTRDWCRREILMAKEAGCPVVAILALDNGEARSFAYAGNVPTVTWPLDGPQPRIKDAIHRLVRVVLGELLRSSYFLRQCESLNEQGFLPKPCLAIGSPPELLTYHFGVRQRNTKTQCLLLYPDPPLGFTERKLLDELHSNVTVATPMTSSGWERPGSNVAPLEALEIALSIGDVPAADLLAVGLSEQHFQDAMIEVSRHLLARGATLAYGGAPDKTFTESLLDLVESHTSENNVVFKRLRNYVARPYLPADRIKYVAEHIQSVDLVPIPDAADIADLPIEGPGITAEESLYRKARHLTEMRRFMANRPRMMARVAMGGKLRGFSGRYPGIVEEALTFLSQGKPLFLLGGFGGCAAAVADALKGTIDERLDGSLRTEEEHKRIKYFNAHIGSAASEDRIDYAWLGKTLREGSIAGLRNGLSDAENEVLFASRDLTEIVYYLLKGLTNLKDQTS